MIKIVGLLLHDSSMEKDGVKIWKKDLILKVADKIYLKENILNNILISLKVK